MSLLHTHDGDVALPILALPVADPLADLVHTLRICCIMPTGIDATVGDYRRAVGCKDEGLLADNISFAQETSTVLCHAYRVQYTCASLYSAMMSCQSADAISATENLEYVIDPNLLFIKRPLMADCVESFVGRKVHMLVRLGC
ncbi:hypothetical protein BDV27DRAFT_156354 [Aspergillus caelatus]|uniref:Uncharacterized protein n=1 Tax=Aspergillus caelatus TaxID=61420 RepID=A0A5N7A8T2_9EURO|nr:uncharacterized protein BDV27DRAFT_156354 [Aspergillus caelatus]KAE8366053.1 hypothetical protein BDV27DRAFT_156354 [Aspergillus caelatus]